MDNQDDDASAHALDVLESLSGDHLLELPGDVTRLDDSTVRRVRVTTEQLLASNEELRTELRRRRRVTEQLRILASAVYVTGDGIGILTPDAGGLRAAFVNEALCTITGRRLEQLIGGSIETFGIGIEHPVFLAVQQHVLNDKRFRGEVIATRPDGAEYALELELIPVPDRGSGATTHWVALLRDVSEMRSQMLTLERQALYDVMTDLPNRVLFYDRLDQAIASASRDMTSFALMTLDLDRFKEINDAFGHHAGDALLQHVSARFREEVRATDTVARVGGDEFAFIFPDIDGPSRAATLAHKLLKVFDNPFPIEGRLIPVCASVGVVTWPHHGADATILLRRADASMYRAKQTNSGYALYDRSESDESLEQLTLARDLRRAIDEDELRLFYQPKVHIQSGLTTRVEVLVRWNHPQLGLLSPLSFIPLAERTGLIKPMTDWVLDRSLQQCRSWNDAGIPLHIAVNLSTRSLQEPFLPEKIQEALEKWGVEPRHLKLEITESSILADPPQVMAILALIQTLGVRLSIDDFGTGYSSLVHLRQLAVDEIKIDQSFVRTMCTDEGNAAVVKATIDLAHSLGRQVVAEGVEDLETLQMLDRLGCDLAQGYYYTRPLPAPELERWLETTRWGFDPTAER